MRYTIKIGHAGNMYFIVDDTNSIVYVVYSLLKAREYIQQITDKPCKLKARSYNA